jgi:hypothetical protein
VGVVAGDFRIAGGYVEVTVQPSREQLRRAAQEATTEFEAGMSGRFGAVGEHAGQEFAVGARSSIGRDLETVMADVADRSGTDFVMHVDRVLRGEGARLKKTGEDLGEDLLKGIGGGSGGSGGITSLFSGIGAKLSSIFTGASTSAHQAFADMKQGISQVSDAFSGLSKVAGFAWGVVKFVGGPGETLELLPPLLSAIAGGLASIPALATAAGLALASMELGTQGIGAAIGQVFNPTGGGAGGAANRLNQVASAERNLAVAERDEREAQQALTEARVQAAFHLQDLNLQMERQQENEASARLAIMEAQQALMQAEATGDPLAIMRAQLAMQEAVTGLKEQQQQTVELTYTKQQADQKGVEGSDQVVAALDRVQNASNAVIDAQNAVKQASISAAAGAVTAYSKLSPEAKKFVDEIARLKPELVGLQQYVQDRLFVGLDKKLGTWATVWIPALRHDLGEIAGDANTFAKRLGDDLSKPEIVQAVKGVADAMDRIFTRFTTGGALDKLVTGFGDLVTAATPFVEALADAAIDKLAAWADDLDKAAKDGSLTSFFKEASKDLHDIWDIGSDVVGIVGKILSAAFGADTANNNGKNGLDRLKDTLDQFNTWLSSDTGKQDIKEIAGDFMAIADAIGWVIVHLGKFIVFVQDTGKENKKATDALKSDWQAFKTGLAVIFESIELVVAQFFQTIIDNADRAFSWVPGLGPKLDQAKREMNAFVDSINADLDRIKSEKDITIRVNNAGAQATHGGGSQGRQSALQRWGGVHWAQDGLVSLGNRSAGIYARGPLFGFAEPDTGGELFMPRNGDPDRNKALAAIAAQWAGLSVAPARSPIAAGMGTGPAATPVQHGPYIFQVDGHVMAAFMVDAITGNPTAVSAAAAEGDRRRRFTNSARA